MRRFFSRLFIILGFLLIIGAAGLGIYNVYDNYRAGKEADEVLDAIESEMDADLTLDSDDVTALEAAGSSDQDGDQELYEEYPEMSMPTVEIDGYRYIGVLNVPRFDLTLPVMEEWDYTRLHKGPCRYTGSVYSDDITIAAHNYTRHFGRLHRLNSGDVVTFTDVDGNIFEYHVINVEILDPTAIEQMTEKSEDDTWDMTLFTCTLGGKTRYAIRLERVE